MFNLNLSLLNPSRVRALLVSKLAQRREPLDDITLGKTDKWATFWLENGEEVGAIMTALLMRKYEQGNQFPSKDFEQGFRQGLIELPSLFRKCYELRAQQQKVLKLQDEQRKKKNERRTSIV
jgi:hypothetical protein